MKSFYQTPTLPKISSLALWSTSKQRGKKNRAGLAESYKWWLKGLEKDLLKEVKKMDIIHFED